MSSATEQTTITAADRHIVWLALSDELPPLIRIILGT